MPACAMGILPERNSLRPHKQPTKEVESFSLLSFIFYLYSFVFCLLSQPTYFLLLTTYFLLLLPSALFLLPFLGAPLALLPAFSHDSLHYRRQCSGSGFPLYLFCRPTYPPLRKGCRFNPWRGGGAIVCALVRA